MTTRSYARGQVKDPYRPEGPGREMVKYLRVMAFRYLRGNANVTELVRACDETMTALGRRTVPGMDLDAATRSAKAMFGELWPGERWGQLTTDEQSQKIELARIGLRAAHER